MTLSARSRWAAVLVGMCAAGLFAACASPIEPHGSRLIAGDASLDASQDDGSAFGNSHHTVASDAMTTSDAFFINDPVPPHCGPDGGMTTSAQPGGSVSCPDDKNRDGCPCPSAGTTAACWPGKRANRNHGVCKDGMTTCIQTDEFGLRWGRCEGYVLPAEGAVAGPEACGCFSEGTWSVTNLAPCLHTASGQTYLYASHLDAAGKIECNSVGAPPPPAPPEDWNSSTLNVECAGSFELCYAIKAGAVGGPKADDCTITKQCVQVWYQNAGQTQPLPNLPGWASSDTACGQRFVDVGGYGEMSVKGESVECDEIDDGQGNAYVFRRTAYCPPRCLATPTAPDCVACQAGGSGAF